MHAHFHYIYQTFIYLSVDRHLGCFHLSVVINNVPVTLWCSHLSSGPCFHHYNTLTTPTSTSCSGLLQRPPNWSPCFCSCCIHPCQVCSTQRNQDNLLKTKSDHVMSLFKSSVSCVTQGINKNGNFTVAFRATAHTCITPFPQQRISHCTILELYSA